jgi:hypothetical protein
MTRETLYETETYVVILLRAGMVLRHKPSQCEVYVRPGKDTSAMLANLAALSEVLLSKRCAVFDIMVSEYFA